MDSAATNRGPHVDAVQGHPAGSPGCDVPRFCVIHVGAGSGTRLNSAVRKAMVLLDGRPLWWHGARAFQSLAPRAQVLVLHAEDVAATGGEPLRSWLREAGIERVVSGGATRQDSVSAGLHALGPESGAGTETVLVHDAARPFISVQSIRALLRRLAECDAALLATRITATVQQVDGRGLLAGHLDREALRLATTPQGARRTLLQDLLQRAHGSGLNFTDEASLCRHFGVPVAAVEDSPRNFKITTAEDLAMARALTETVRVGHGYDIHRLVAPGPLRLGGIDIPAEVHAHGHSDGDALLHAVMEALLGAASLSDIGEHFPDTDPQFRGIDSRELLRRTLAELRGMGLCPAQVDCSIIAERPRLGAHKAAIRDALCLLLDLPPQRVAVKARTHEGLDALGRGEAIAVHALATLRSC